jgi:hypothetical protein
MLQIQSFTVGPLAENPHVLICAATRQAAIVDPGDEADLL